MNRLFLSHEYPPTVNENSCQYNASHSMIESRRRQLTQSISKLIIALDLNANQERIDLVYSNITAPTGIPISKNTNEFYEMIITSLVKVIANTSFISNYHGEFSEKLKNISVDNICLNTFIDLINPSTRQVNSAKGKYTQDKFAFRVWFQNQSTITSRILLLLIDSLIINEKNKYNPVNLFQKTFGNVDVCIIPPEYLKKVSKYALNFIRLNNQHVHLICPKTLVSISLYLDHGQMLNLSDLKTQGVSDLGDKVRSFSEDCFQQNFHDLTYYSYLAPNGCLMTRPLPNTLKLLHLTPYKKEILQSKELRISRAGCLGNMLYTTTLVGKKSDIFGGHTIGLYNRKYSDSLLDKASFILLEVDQLGNQLTNWIEKLGRGRLFLEARNKMLSSCYSEGKQRSKNSSYFGSLQQATSSKIDSISVEALEQYSRLYCLFAFFNDYVGSKKKEICNNNILLKKTFNIAKNLLEHVSKNPDGTPCYSVLNNIFFEVIKDYIILFQTDKSSLDFRENQSFNMHNQYLIFFELFPQLSVDWKTSKIPVDISTLVNILNKWKFLNTVDDELIFMTFFLDRLAYYVNIGCLEGSNSLPHPDNIRSFDELANCMPNLMGLIFNSIIKIKYENTKFFDDYSQQLNKCYDISYNDRNINIAIKCGVCGTDEIGVRPAKNIRFFNIDILKESGFYKAKQMDLLDLSIKGISEKNGFTKRFNEKRVYIDNLSLDLTKLSDPNFDL